MIITYHKIIAGRRRRRIAGFFAARPTPLRSCRRGEKNPLIPHDPRPPKKTTPAVLPLRLTRSLPPRAVRGVLQPRPALAGPASAGAGNGSWRATATCAASVSLRRRSSSTTAPPANSPSALITLCRACHARLHRLHAIDRWVPDLLETLWAEQHPRSPRQLQLPADLLG